MTDKARITESALLGQAVGDALGVPVESMARSDVRRIDLTEMEGYDTQPEFASRWGYVIPAGAWSDDTSMTVAAMASISANKGRIVNRDIMDQFCAWWEESRYCSIDHAFGLGGTVGKALANYKRNPYAAEYGPYDFNANGNGSLMRILPFSLYCIYRKLDDRHMVETINAASALTHGHPISKMGCTIFTVFLKALLSSKTVGLAWDFARAFNYADYYDRDCLKAYSMVLSEEFPKASDDRIEFCIAESGYVVDSLATAVYSLLRGQDYESSVLRAINMGYDTDTNAAITGALAGAFYGLDSIPDRWLSKLRKKDKLISMADRFTKAVCAYSA